MYKRIILAYDGTASGQRALLNIRDFAHWGSRKLTLLAVVPYLEIDAVAAETGYLGRTGSAESDAETKEILRKGVRALRSMGFEADGEFLKGDAIREITRCATDRGADLIVVGHKHEKNLLRRWWSGSTAKSLVEEVTCNVLIVIEN